MTGTSIPPLGIFKNKEVPKRRERLTTILRKYWDKIRGDDAFPPEDRVNAEVVIDIWNSCFVVEANNETREGDYFYKYIGEKIREAYKNELDGFACDHIVNTQAGHLAGEYEKVLAIKRPVYYEGEIPIRFGKSIKYRQILLPLGDGIRIEAIMGGFSYSVFDNGRG